MKRIAALGGILAVTALAQPADGGESSISFVLQDAGEVDEGASALDAGDGDGDEPATTIDAGIATSVQQVEDAGAAWTDAGCDSTGHTLSIESIDGNRTPVTATIIRNNTPAGTTPLKLDITRCDTQLTIENNTTHKRQQIALASPQTHVIVNWDNRYNYWSATIFADGMFFAHPTPFVPPGQPRAMGVLGGGIRFDRWGKHLHGSIAITANPILAPALFSLLSLQVPVLPSIDLFLGYLNRELGNTKTRALFSAQLGLWSLVFPALRTTIGAMLFDTLILTITVDARVMLPKYLPISLTALPGPLSLGLTAGAGVAW